MNSLISTALLVNPATTWSPEQINQTKIVSDVQLSPDNHYALMVISEPDMKEEKGVMRSRIYKSTLGSAPDITPVTALEVSSAQPRWSPDGKWIAFISKRDGHENLYLCPADGGEATALTHVTKNIQNYDWSPDGQKIAFVMADEVEAEKNQNKSSLAYVYQNNEPVNRLWLLDVASKAEPKALTPDGYCVRGSGDFGTVICEYNWSPDGKNIVFAYSPGTGPDFYHLDSSLATVDIATGQIIPWAKRAPYEAMPRYSPDGQSIAYMKSNSPNRYGINRHVAIRTKDGEFVRKLAPTFNEGVFLFGANLLGWTQDGKSVLFFEPKQTKYHLVVLPVDGSAATELQTGSYFFKEPSLSNDRSMLGFIIQSPAIAPEAYVSDISSFHPRKISQVNLQPTDESKIRTETVTWKSNDGLEIEGLLTYPLQYREGKAYPLLVVIHGGPMGFFDESYVGTPNPYPIASFAEAGFLVFRPNPRGSTGYGEKFRSANYRDWGGRDYQDIMTGVDALIAKGIADPERMGIMGWSYGGYMAAWVVGQTSRFKAASIGAAPSNLVSLSGTTDLHRLAADYLGNFVNQPELYRERSPLTYVSSIQTPCLLQHGTADPRVPVSQSYELYHALKSQGNKPILILYPGMGHRIADPKMQLDAMRSNLTWFQTHLLSDR